MVKGDTKKTNTFGKKKGRRQQLLAARQSRSVNKSSSSTQPGPSSPSTTPEPLLPSPQPDLSPPSPTPGPSSSPPDSLPQPVSSASGTPSASAQPIEHDVVCSASKRKLSYQFEPVQDHEESTRLPSTIADLEMLKPLFSGLLCPNLKCRKPSLVLENDKKKNSGLAISLIVRCSECGNDLNSTMTSSKCAGAQSVFDVNRRATAAASATGMGYAGLANFSEFMNIPVVHHKTFAAHTKVISDRSEVFSRDVMEKAVETVKAAYPEQTSNVKDIHVSFDGSWHKRGHTSKSGIGLVIERKTGLIVDYEVLTSYCPICATTGKRLEQENVVKYQRWQRDHKTVCSANYQGPSGGMEKEAALRIWSRSVVKNNLRYVSMISDGDAKTISELHALDPYPGIKVAKHECVNHVGKRLGTALRNLVAEKSKAKPKVTLGGKGHGKLRSEVIATLQRYYTKAIRSNTTVPATKEAVTAIIDHGSSTDADPKHDNCPKGDDSWCFWQKANAKGLPPGSHEDNVGTPLCKIVVDSIRPTFERMSTDELLGRCILQTTQNANESAHALIWARCPKHQFVNRNRLSIAVSVGVAEFNFGASASRKFLDNLSLPVGEETRRRGKKRDYLRTVKAEAAVTEKAKRFRQAKADAKQREEQRLIDIHGQFYVSGGGD